MTQHATHVARATDALRTHWPEYAMEAIELGLFMISACAFTILLFHPQSPATLAIESPVIRRGLMGLAMGLTAVAIIYSPMGQRSGAHMNPATTLAFWRLGKVAGWDAAYYIIAQFVGGAGGVLVVSAFAKALVSHPAVNHAATVPGEWGFAAAWAAEFAIAFILMSVILQSSNRRATAPHTGLLAGMLVAAYILIESPVSGMSMNPARTLSSAIGSQMWTGLWIYFTAPPLAMLAAAEVHVRVMRGKVHCAKLHHRNSRRCIFRCRFAELLTPPTPAQSDSRPRLQPMIEFPMSSLRSGAIAAAQRGATVHDHPAAYDLQRPASANAGDEILYFG